MEIVEGLFEVIKQIPLLFLLHHNVINVGFDISPKFEAPRQCEHTSDTWLPHF
jgi:hypothetical protein